MDQLIMDITGPVLGWASSTWARAGLGRELVSPWRALMRTTGILLRLLAYDLWHLPTVTADRRYVRTRLLVAHHCAGSLGHRL